MLNVYPQVVLFFSHDWLRCHMSDPKCTSPYIQAIIDIIERTEQIRRDRGFVEPRTIVKCEDGVLLITRRVILDDSSDPFEVFLRLKVDDQVSLLAVYSGGTGVQIRADDVEEFHPLIISAGQNTAIIYSMYGWVTSIEPKGNYGVLPAVNPIPLYAVRRESLEHVPPKRFGSMFVQAMRDLDNTILAISQIGEGSSKEDENLDKAILDDLLNLDDSSEGA